MTQAGFFASRLDSKWEAGTLDEAFLRQVVVEHYEREHFALRRYLSFLGLNPESAQEIVQESFLRLYQHLLNDGDRTNLRAWLYRVGHNLARNEQMAARNRKSEALDDALALELRTNGESPEEQVLSEERTRRLREAVQQLSPAQKECLVLRAQGLKYREISEILSLSISTVGENVQRGLHRLKEIL